MLMRTPVIKPTDSPPEERRLDAEISGLDALEAGQKDGGDRKVRAWSATWPKLAALAVALLVWEVVVRSGWKPEYVLPGPAAVFRSLQEKLADGRMVEAAARTMRRAPRQSHPQRQRRQSRGFHWQFSCSSCPKPRCFSSW